MAKECRCGSTTGECPECNKEYKLGTTTHCTKKACEKMNAPIDCTGCGFVVSADNDGVLNFDMKLIPWKSTRMNPGGDKKPRKNPGDVTIHVDMPKAHAAKSAGEPHRALLQAQAGGGGGGQVSEPVSGDDSQLGGDPVPLDQHGEFVVEVSAPPDDGRCVAGWGLRDHGYPDSARCGNKATMPDLLCLKCHLEFRPRKT